VVVAMAWGLASVGAAMPSKRTERNGIGFGWPGAVLAQDTRPPKGSKGASASWRRTWRREEDWSGVGMERFQQKWFGARTRCGLCRTA